MQNEVTARHVAHANGDEILVRGQIAGVLCEQDGHEAALEAGDITLFDPRRPMQANISTVQNNWFFRFPRRHFVAGDFLI